MFRVAIIDDEPLIVEGLCRTLPWEKWNCQVAGSAYNGREGLEMIRQVRPNIIITDINMPELDGLKMIAALKSEFPYMQLIILTGYREFEYAREAISLGVARFLLKPSKMSELEEALDEVTRRLAQTGEIFPEVSLPNEAGTSEDEEDISYHSEANSFIVKNALEYIQENSQEKLRLTDVADQVYVSQWHLSKLLNKHLAQSFYDLLNAERIRQAKRLMADPALRISEVAERVGYADTAHFSRVFKKLEGVSAGEWRNLCGGKS